MFRRLLASVGIGSADVETQLQSNIVSPGGALQGVTHVRGGNVDLEVDDLYLYLIANVKEQSGDSYHYQTKVFQKHKLSDRFLIHANEARQFPFALQLPYDLPITQYQGTHFDSKTPFTLKTDLDVDFGTDQQDLDPFEVEAHPAQARLLQVMNQIGFQLFRVDIEEGKARGGTLPFSQEFEYTTSLTPYANDLSELEMIMVGKATGFDVLFEMDKKQGSFGLFGGRETTKRLSIDYKGWENMDFASAIDKTLRSSSGLF